MNFWRESAMLGQNELAGRRAATRSPKRLLPVTAPPRIWMLPVQRVIYPAHSTSARVMKTQLRNCFLLLLMLWSSILQNMRGRPLPMRVKRLRAACVFLSTTHRILNKRRNLMALQVHGQRISSLRRHSMGLSILFLRARGCVRLWRKLVKL